MYQVETLWHTSQVLRENPCGDPATRPVIILSPPGTPKASPLPAVWMLAPFMSTGAAFLSFRPWQETLLDRIHRLSETGQVQPVRWILPDVFTAFGGSQYIDSAAIGAYRTYLWEELLPFVEARYQTTQRGLAGSSSGGFGALVTALTGPVRISAVAVHAADMGFEWCYLPDFPKLFRVLRSVGGLYAFWQTWRKTPNKPADWLAAINLIAMAAYSPNLSEPPPHLDLPVDAQSLEIYPAVWKRWLAWDPLQLITETDAAERARRLRLLYFDVGEDDEYNLQYGAYRWHRQLERLGIPHRYETFPGGHRGTHVRDDESLSWLTAALTD